MLRSGQDQVGEDRFMTGCQEAGGSLGLSRRIAGEVPNEVFVSRKALIIGEQPPASAGLRPDAGP